MFLLHVFVQVSLRENSPVIRAKALRAVSERILETFNYCYLELGYSFLIFVDKTSFLPPICMMMAG